MHDLSSDTASIDATVKQQVNQALIIAPGTVILSAMSQEMYSRAAVLLDLLDRIGHSLGDSLEPQHVEDSLPFRLEAVVLQRTLSIGSPLRSQGELARLLWNLAIVLHKLGRNKEPCLVDEEALAIRRDCHRSRPDANLHLLAAQLHVYSIQLHCEERYLEAVEACEEAAMLRRSLYECDPSKHTEPLAKSLHNLAAFLTSAERLEDAKVIGEEAIMLRRILLEKEPGQHRKVFSDCLRNYHLILRALRPDEGVRNTQDGCDALSELLA